VTPMGRLDQKRRRGSGKETGISQKSGGVRRGMKEGMRKSRFAPIEAGRTQKRAISRGKRIKIITIRIREPRILARPYTDRFRLELRSAENGAREHEDTPQRVTNLDSKKKG